MAGLTEPRRYSVHEANRALPDVAQTIGMLRRIQRKVRNLDARLEILNLVCDKFIAVRNPDLREFLTLKIRYHRRIGQFHEVLRDLESKGCSVEDLKRGIVHFEARRGDDRVILCWHEGEREVSHWHPIEDLEKPEDETQRHSIEAWDQF